MGWRGAGRSLSLMNNFCYVGVGVGVCVGVGVESARYSFLFGC